MSSHIYMKSLCDDAPIYTWCEEERWEQHTSQVKIPQFMWLSNQTGMQVGSYGNVEVESFQSLLGALPSIHKDLVLDTLEITGYKSTASISLNRWESLAEPRPILNEQRRLDGPIAIKDDGRAYFFQCDIKGHGGWFQLKERVDTSGMAKFEMWDYTVYHNFTRRLIWPGRVIKKLITSTLDCLYCYDLDDAAFKSYLVYAQPKMGAVWERSLAYAVDDKTTG